MVKYPNSRIFKVSAVIVRGNNAVSTAVILLQYIIVPGTGYRHYCHSQRMEYLDSGTSGLNA